MITVDLKAITVATTGANQSDTEASEATLSSFQHPVLASLVVNKSAEKHHKHSIVN